MQRTETYRHAATRILGERIRKFVQMCRMCAAHATAENIHDLRVSARRLAAAQAVFDLPELAALKHESRAIRRMLGEMRDLDVAVANVRKLAKGSEWEARIEPWLKRLKRRRRKLLAMTRPLLRISIVRVPVAIVRSDSRSFAACAPDHLATHLQEARALLARVGSEDAQEEIHKLRVRIKRIRYTLELFGGALDSRADEWLAACKRLQDALGSVHDHDMLIERAEREWKRLTRESAEEAMPFEWLLNEVWRARHRLHARLADSLSDPFLGEIAARLTPTLPTARGVGA